MNNQNPKRSDRLAPLRVYIGAAVISVSFLVRNFPYYFVSDYKNNPPHSAETMLMLTLPGVIAHGLLAIGIAFIVLGCIDYARAPR